MFALAVLEPMQEIIEVIIIKAVDITEAEKPELKPTESMLKDLAVVAVLILQKLRVHWQTSV